MKLHFVHGLSVGHEQPGSLQEKRTTMIVMMMRIGWFADDYDYRVLCAIMLSSYLQGKAIGRGLVSVNGGFHHVPNL